MRSGLRLVAAGLALGLVAAAAAARLIEALLYNVQPLDLRIWRDGIKSREVRVNMLQTGEQVPHFTVETLNRERCAYTSIWQRRNLVLIALPATGGNDEAVHQLVGEVRAAPGLDADVVATRDAIDGITAPAILVADRWGEIMHVEQRATLPSSADVIAWVEYVRQRCPECEGETR